MRWRVFLNAGIEWFMILPNSLFTMFSRFYIHKVKWRVNKPKKTFTLWLFLFKTIYISSRGGERENERERFFSAANVGDGDEEKENETNKKKNTQQNGFLTFDNKKFWKMIITCGFRIWLSDSKKEYILQVSLILYFFVHK